MVVIVKFNQDYDSKEYAYKVPEYLEDALKYGKYKYAIVETPYGPFDYKVVEIIGLFLDGYEDTPKATKYIVNIVNDSSYQKLKAEQKFKDDAADNFSNLLKQLDYKDFVEVFKKIDKVLEILGE